MNEEEKQKFAALMKEANPTIKVLFEVIQMRHPDNPPAALLASAALLHVILKITECPLSANDVTNIVGSHLDFGFYPSSPSNETH